MKLKAKVNQVVTLKSKKTGNDYTKVKVTVEDGHDQQTGFVFWNDSLGKPPMPGELILADFGLAASEQGDLQIKMVSFAKAA